MTDPAPSSPAYRSARAITVVLITLIVLLAADLAVKHWAFSELAADETVTVIPNVLALHRVQNEGAVFGIGQGKQSLFIMFTFLAVAVIGGMFAFSKSNERWFHLALAAIAAGAVGNLYDRMAFNFVRDMLYLFPDVHLPFGWAWPNGSSELYPWVFNLADCYLVLAIAFLLIRSFFVKPPTDAKKDAKAPNGK